MDHKITEENDELSMLEHDNKRLLKGFNFPIGHCNPIMDLL